MGINFYVGGMDGLLDLTKRGGLVAVPSAPVLVDLADHPAHREAVEGCDFAITDSGFMVWLWLLRRGERLERISGLKYIRALLNDPDFRRPGATFWVMPSLEDADANLYWLKKQGLEVSHADCYIAPMYPKGPLSDPELLSRIEAAQPRFVMMCLGGGVQERLGYFLKRELEKSRAEKPETRNLRPEEGFPDSPPSGQNPQVSGLKSQVSPHLPLTSYPLPAAPRLPAIICTGAAIAFLSGRQVNIPPWADKWILGWLFRCLYQPGKFIPRYWRSLRLVLLLFRHADKSVSDPNR